MKIVAPLSNSILLLVVTVLLFGLFVVAPLSSSAQKRGRATQNAPSKAAGLVDEADKMADDKKWPEAIDAYKLAIRLDANYSLAYGGLGDAYFNSGNSEPALAAYKEQVRLAPNDAMAQYDLGYFYNAMGRHGEAFAPLVKATGLDPNFAEAYYGIGYAYLRGADFEKSISFLKSAIRIKPDYGDAYYGLGQAYARLGKADLANEQLKKLNTVDAKLARKLEKEIQTALAAAADTSNTTSTPAKQVVQSEPQPSTSSAPTQTQEQPKPASPVTREEPASRQLQQIEQSAQKAPEQTADGLNQIKALPAKAKRWALVIGVDKYTDPQISALKGSDNDARLMADALIRYSGFPQDQVILLSTNQPVERQPTRVNILRRLSNLSTAVPKDGLLLISFAGHGMERGGQAFLLPSDAQISDQISFLEDTAISVSRIKDQVKQIGVSQVVVLLDACRNDPGGRADAPNPLTNAYTNAFNFDVRNREVQAFATIYATGIGQRAYEYTEKKQGYFSWAMVEGLKGGAANDKGEITLSQLVKYVQDTVPKRLAIDLGSTKQQRPFAIIEGFRADELVVAVTNAASNVSSAPIPGVNMVDPAAIELSYWDTIKNSTNADDFQSYLDKYPDGQFAALARLRAQPAKPAASSAADSSNMEMAYWNAIKDSKNPSDFKAYQARFPNGFFADLAASRVTSLGAEAREREKAKESAEALLLDGTTWVGKSDADYPVRFEFVKGGMFVGTYMTVVVGFLIDDYPTLKLSGTWRQTGDSVTVQLSQPAAEVMSIAVNETQMQGSSAQSTYKFSLEKLLKKPLSTDSPQSSGPCDFHGFKVKIMYRKKDKVDRTEEAAKLAERLKSFGAEVEVEKYNWKDSGTALFYYNGQADIANKIVECVKEMISLKVVDQKESANANKFTLWLQ